MNYLDGLNEVQYKAVTHLDGPVLVIAGPGSGKTRVLTLRIAHILNSGIAPYQVLALTFTNKAATEMKARISKVAEPQAVQQIWAGTFHSVFARILRAEAEKIGFPSSFSIYDSNDAKSLIREIVRGQGLDAKVYDAGAIYSAISMAKNSLVSPLDYRLSAERLMEDKQKQMPYIYKIYDIYVQRCQRAGAMDFDDLLYQTHRLLTENPDNVLEKYRKKFRYVLVDEYQDTNKLQYGIVQLLVHYPGSPRNICVVGDDAQSIYAFRGATIDNIIDFEKDFPEAAIYKLEQNYRSTDFIVQAANDLIAKNSKQLRKHIFTDKGKGDPIRILRAVTDTEEAKLVVDTLRELKVRRGWRNEDFAILYRTNAQSRVFEEALKHQRIAYKVYGGLSFYERKEVKDVISYLRVIVNPKDEEALRRIVNYPTRGIGDSSLQKLSEVAEREERPLWDILKEAGQHALPKATSNSIIQFVRLIELFQEQLLNRSAYELAFYVVKMIGLADDLKKDKQQGKERWDNVNELLDGIKAFVEDDEVNANSTNIADKSLTSYLQNVILLTDLDSSDEEQSNRVKLMSVHAAKGLEFKGVFVVGLEENLFPSTMANKAKDPRAAIEEERRLFYVAVTRAEQALVLSYAGSRYRFGKMQYNNSSRFLDEISPDYLDFSGLGSPGRSGAASSAQPTRRLAQVPTAPQTAVKLPANFKPSPPNKVVAGAQVFHERFGPGKVIAIDGAGDNRVATILFQAVGEKRIMLRLAKMQVLS